MPIEEFSGKIVPLIAPSMGGGSLEALPSLEPPVEPPAPAPAIEEFSGKIEPLAPEPVPSRPETALGQIGRSFADIFAGTMKGAATIYNTLPGRLDTINPLIPGPPIDISPQDPRKTPLYKAGQYVSDYANELTKNLINPEYEQEFVTGKVTQGIGATLGFAAAAPFGGLRMIAGLGALVNGQQGFEDALSHGASIKDAYKSYIPNAVVGTTEVVSFLGFLDRLDKGTGGLIKRSLVNAFKTGTEEATQEALQQITGNLVASDYVKYDPERRWFEGSGENAGVGFTAGALLSFLGSVVAGKRALSRTPPDIIPPPFGSVKPEPEVRLPALEPPGELGIIESKLGEIVRQPSNAEELLGGQKKLEELSPLIASLETKVRNLPGQENYAFSSSESISNIPWNDYIGALSNEASKTRGLFRQEAPKPYIGAPESYAETYLEDTYFSDSLSPRTAPLSLTSPIKYRYISALAEYSGPIKTTQEQITSISEMPPGTVAMFGFKDENLSTVNKIFERVLRDQQKYLRTTSILITDGKQIDEKITPKNTDGYAGKFDDNTYILNVQSHRLGDAVENFYPGGLASAEKEVNINRVLAHEFGHTLAFEKLESAPKEYQDAILADYTEFLSKGLEGTLSDLIQSKFALSKAKQYLRYMVGHWPELADKMNTVPVKELIKIQDQELHKKLQYILSADEWIADQMARYAEHPSYGGTKSARIFTRLSEYMRKYYNSSVKDLYAPKQSFVKWLEDYATQNADNALLGNTAGVRIAKDLTKLGIYSDESLEGTNNPWVRAGELDRFNKMMEYGYTAWQIAALNPHISGAQEATRILEQMAATKNRLLHKAEKLLTESGNLGKARSGRVYELLLTETSEGKMYDLADLNIIKKYQLDPEMVAFIKNVKETFRDGLSTMERTLTGQLVRKFKNDPAALQKAVEKLHKEFQAMYAKPYFPLPRFGNLTVVTKANSGIVINNKTYKKGEPVDSRQYESKSDAKEGLEEVKKEFAKYDVTIGEGLIEDAAFEFRGVPPQLFEALKDELKLTPRQIRSIDEYSIEIAPGRSYLKHLKRRRGIAGFSHDGERGLALYLMRMSNHLARLQHYEKLSAAVKSIADDATIIRDAGGNARKRQAIHQSFAELYDYIMNPTNEWAGLRSLAFNMHLGFLPRGAVMNLSQIPLATYPKLAKNFGDAKAGREILRAGKDAVNILRRPNRVDLTTREAVAWGTDQGFIDQSFATLVAGVAEGHLLSRALPGTQGARVLKQISHYSSFMFAEAEKFNRRATFIAAYRLAKESGKTEESAREYGREATRLTQGEYGKWARPKIFRGKKSALFIFKLYQQNMLYFLFHSDARARAWLMLGLIGGVAGLPFADDLMDLINSLLSAGQNKKFDSRKWIKEHLKLIMNEPDLILHGISRDTFGFGFFASYIGIPFPHVDMSGSISLGRVVPGVQALPSFAKGHFSEGLGRVTAEAVGAGFAIPLQMAQAIVEFDKNPAPLRALERMLPAAARSIAKAVRYYEEGGVTDRRLAMKVPMSWQDPEQRMEIIAQALGFAPTRVSERYDQDSMYKAHAQFYALRQQKLIQDFTWARIERDREAIADVRQGIKQYNEEVPDKRLRINNAMLSRSVRQRLRGVNLTEQGRPLEGRKYRGLYNEIDRLFQEEPDIEDFFGEITMPPGAMPPGADN